MADSPENEEAKVIENSLADRQRDAKNNRQRARTTEISQAEETLKDEIPCATLDEKSYMNRLRTIHLTTDLIKHFKEMYTGEQAITPTGTRPLTLQDYRHAITTELSDPDSGQLGAVPVADPRGRSGPPQLSPDTYLGTTANVGAVDEFWQQLAHQQGPSTSSSSQDN